MLWRQKKVISDLSGVLLTLAAIVLACLKSASKVQESYYAVAALQTLLC